GNTSGRFLVLYRLLDAIRFRLTDTSTHPLPTTATIDLHQLRPKKKTDLRGLVVARSMRISSAAPAICFHCGEACMEEHVVADAHDFCCHGCKAVHDLLRDSGLHTY